ncbi:MAG: hypothetical protein GX946_00100 [Oligosphaeraceae bacterium]|nr:hypothetical protein [Oligosphaeraceae bacterium]
MQNRSQQHKPLTSCLGISASLFLLCALLLFIAHSKAQFGEFQLVLPDPPFLGQPGLLSLEIQSWRKPKQEQLHLLSSGEKLDFSAAELQLLGLGRHGFKWQLQRKFWAIRFGNYMLRGADYANVHRQVFDLQLETMPRPAVAAPIMPDYRPDTSTPSFAISFLIRLSLILAGLDLLLLFISRYHSAKAKALRSLRTYKHYSPAAAHALWHIWQSYASTCWHSYALGTQIRRLRFAGLKNPEPLYHHCRLQLHVHLRLAP